MNSRTGRLQPAVIAAWFFAFLIPLLFTSSLPAYAQVPDTVWVRLFGDAGKSEGRDLEVVEDGIVVTGTKNMIEGHPPLPALWLFKVDFDGNLVWDHEFGDNTVERGYAVARTLDGGFIASGSDWHENIPNAYIVKTDSAGTLEWEHTYTSDHDCFARDIATLPGGGYIVTGALMHPGYNNREQIDAFLMKLDDAGEMIWQRTYGGSFQADETWSVEVLEDGFVIGGRTWSDGAGLRDAVLAKTDLDGNVMWYTTCGGENKDHIYEIQALDGGGFIATGKTESFGHGWINHGDIWMLRFDAGGTLLWDSTIGHEPTEFGRSVDVLDNGDYIVTGLTITQINNNQIFVGRADSDGNWLWSYDFGAPGMDDAWCVRKMPDGDFVVAGYSQSLGDVAQSLLLMRITDRVNH